MNTANRLLLAAAALWGLMIFTNGGLARPDDEEDVRKGRPHSQISYKGSSPYFKVDFDRYTGAVTCVWCHPKATAIWKKEEAFHVKAFESLTAEARKKLECVKCHVTAFNQDEIYPFEEWEKATERKLGYTWGGDAEVNRHFEGVQCEACHGPNCGNKYSRERLIATCVKCHNEESPDFKGFDADEALKKLKHAKVGAVEKIDYNTYVGLDGCFMCHWPNYQAWKRDQQVHVNAFQVLDEAGRKDPACLKCHTTGFNQGGVYPLAEKEKERSRASGYTYGGDPAVNRKFEGVQCEACHGINCGTYTEVERIRPQCVKCHSGECAHDRGFDFSYPPRLRLVGRRQQ